MAEQGARRPLTLCLCHLTLGVLTYNVYKQSPHVNIVGDKEATKKTGRRFLLSTVVVEQGATQFDSIPFHFLVCILGQIPPVPHVLWLLFAMLNVLFNFFSLVGLQTPSLCGTLAGKAF